MSASIKSLAMSVLQRHGAASIQSQPLTAGETVMRLPEIAPAEGVSGHAEASSAGVELPARRCRACNGWLYWVSVHGAVICAGCHLPANPDLVRRWYWLPEGECKRTQ